MTAPADCKRVAEEYACHLKEVMQNRSEDHRLCLAAQMRAGTIAGVEDPRDSLLSISIDAMDAAKFRVPRNISASKEFQALWRPELTLVGAIIEGLSEHYFIADQDLPKTADMHVAIVGHLLERLKPCEAPSPAPRNLQPLKD